MFKSRQNKSSSSSKFVLPVIIITILVRWAIYLIYRLAGPGRALWDDNVLFRISGNYE